MKKILAAAVVAALTASMAPCAMANTVEPTVRVDGRTLMFREDQPPVILNDRTYVPLRRVLENMDATVNWDGDTKTVEINSFDNINRVILTVDNPEITLYTFTSVLHADEEKITSDVAPIIMNDRTMLPIRVIAEALGATVNWDDEAKITDITTKQAKRYAASAGIDSEAEDFDAAVSVSENVPRLSLAYDGTENIKEGDTVTLKLKLENLAAEDENAKISSVTLSLLFDTDNFEYSGFRCISEDGEISPALSADNPEFADGCVKLITVSLPQNAYLPAEDGTVMEIDFTALNSEGGEFAISDAISELGNNTELIVALDSDTFYTISSYDELYIDTTPVSAVSVAEDE